MKVGIAIPVVVLFCWFLPLFVHSVGESAKNWMVSSSKDVIKFRKPMSLTIGLVLMAVLYPVSFLIIPLTFQMNISGSVLSLCIFGLLCLAWYAAAVHAKPKTIVLDLVSKTFYETQGWLSQTEVREQKITNTARLIFCWTSNYHSLFLQTSSNGQKSRLLLSQSISKRNASGVAYELSQRLALPIVEGPLSKIETL